MMRHVCCDPWQVSSPGFFVAFQPFRWALGMIDFGVWLSSSLETRQHKWSVEMMLLHRSELQIMVYADRVPESLKISTFQSCSDNKALVHAEL